MELKYGTLLINIPTRHIIQKVHDDIDSQLMKLTKIELTNFFVLGNQKTIDMVLSTASKLNIMGANKYAWYVMTLEEKEKVMCSSCKDVHVMYMHPMAKGNDASLGSVRRNYGLAAEPDISVSFYFDAALRGLKGVSNWKDSSDFKALTYTKCSDYAGPEALIREVDLLSHIQKVKVEPNHKALFTLYYLSKERIMAFFSRLRPT